MTATRAVVVTGAGGVGKTTLAAALAVRAARRGDTALVLTVDPARRLAGALGLEHIGNDPVAVPGEARLWAAMLDVTASWEAILHRYAEPAVAERLLVDPFFRAIADRFPAAQSFAAAEQMATLTEEHRWDLIVVDTPPAGGGIDFFLAPRRTGELVGSRLLHWLTGARLPARRALYRLTARPMLRLADTVLGGSLLEGVADFLLDLRTMYDGLRARSRTIERHLRRATTVVVTTADPTPLREVARFFAELAEIRITPRVVVFNRALPLAWLEASRRPLEGVTDPALRAALETNLHRWAEEAGRQETARDEVASRYGVPLAFVPWMPEAPTTPDRLDGLLDVATGLDGGLGP